MTTQPSERPEHDEERPANGGSGDDTESPGRSLLDDDDEIVEPNEPA
jgi:hypothetical protein